MSEEQVTGKFVVLEGVDGSGTTTHTRRLTDALRDKGVMSSATREPSDGPIGMMLRQILTGRIVVPEDTGGSAPGWTTMALLFAADRMDHLQSVVLPGIGKGNIVVSDRYDYSSVAYQSVTSNNEPSAIGWIRELNRFARRPDLTIVLDVPLQTAIERRSSRGAGQELYENDTLQAALVDFYKRMPSLFPDDPVVVVNANRPTKEVSSNILSLVEALINQTA